MGVGGFDPKPDAKHMSSILMGCVWVVEAGAGKNKPSTKYVCLVLIGDEAGARKNNWGKARCVFGMWQMGGKARWEASTRKNKWGLNIYPPMPLVGVLCLVMFWGGNLFAGSMLEDSVGVVHLPANAIGGHIALGNGLGQKSLVNSA